ncbi:MAG: hypothetical protein B7Z60_02405 [Ferrovum sp. 37-45-19]|nr:MAG: hypothetical protein B7Z65_01910 [Ferrovum sp. 21-44-67]OYV95062.1 MAG: hypothetical protein B7Z60_02405 [Ferrovum sp. 37-45-19]OZB33605.1 MAG: hypothetical protein B7X47_03590 [Ferrovum sp. 34-44-207]HQT80877.1 MBL fold metallo-hydrolase [Ferrovaceae bacterium]HQU06617.1 MBL fold metallo-hydrolase [Ferrovaceae bacterium]
MARIIKTLAIFLLYFVTATVESSPVTDEVIHSQSDQTEHFTNLYPDRYPQGNFLKWQWQKLFNSQSNTTIPPTPSVSPDLTLIHHPPKDVLVTWIGHSTILYQYDGVNFLTDPIYSDYASPLPPLGPKRRVPPGVPFNQLPHIDVVVISHNHYDHLDLPTIRALADQTGGPPLFLVPLKVKAWMMDNVDKLNIPAYSNKVQEFKWQQSIHVQGRTKNFTLTFLPVHHWSARSLWDRNETLWGSWAIVHPGFRFWFSGDLGYSKDTVDIGESFKYFDLAAIDIGSYKPRWIMANYHINPSEAVKVMQDVHAKQAFGIHWGVFKLSDESYTQAPEDLNKALVDQHISQDKFIVLKVGESKIYKELN